MATPELTRSRRRHRTLALVAYIIIGTTFNISYAHAGKPHTTAWIVASIAMFPIAAALSFLFMRGPDD